MSQSFSREEVERIAALAALELTAEEVEMFTRQLAGILEYAQQVQTIDTTGVPPTAHVLGNRPVDRPDELRPSLERDEVLAAAPDPSPAAGLFRVPRVIG